MRCSGNCANPIIFLQCTAHLCITGAHPPYAGMASGGSRGQMPVQHATTDSDCADRNGDPPPHHCKGLAPNNVCKQRPGHICSGCGVGYTARTSLHRHQRDKPKCSAADGTPLAVCHGCRKGFRNLCQHQWRSPQCVSQWPTSFVRFRVAWRQTLHWHMPPVRRQCLERFWWVAICEEPNICLPEELLHTISECLLLRWARRKPAARLAAVT